MRTSSYARVGGIWAMATLLSGGSGCDRTADGGGPVAAAPAAEVDLPAQGDAATAGPRTAVFAGGCFWCVEAVFEQLDGVTEAVSGYSGGSADTADYETVCTGTTGHAEAVRVTYDPAKIGYGDLLRVFFSTHDPTQQDRQGPDVGPQYRSAIFYASPEERAVAESYIRQLDRSGIFPRPIATRLEALEAFYPAEDYHQDYVVCNPRQPYVRAHALPKVEKVRKEFAEQVKPPPE